MSVPMGVAMRGFVEIELGGLQVIGVDFFKTALPGQIGFRGLAVTFVPASAAATALAFVYLFCRLLILAPDLRSGTI
jgi:hypothetical protein